MYDLRIKLNQASPQQKQHSTTRIFEQNLGVKFKEETSRGLSLEALGPFESSLLASCKTAPTTATNHIQQNKSNTPNALTRSLFS